MADPSAPSLRDRIAQAVHEEQSVDAVLAVLADADPTDLGFKPVDGITYCTFHDATVTAERARAGACDRAHHFCAEVPVYARPLHRGALNADRDPRRPRPQGEADDDR